MFLRTHVAAVTLAAGMLASAASAQHTKVVTVGPEYAAGGAQRCWLGEGYRDLWTTPVALPVLDPGAEAGGLTPVRQVGQAPIGVGDIGRVWADGEDSTAWHSSLGGGLLVQPLGASFTMHVTAAGSTEGTRLYLDFGYPL